MSYILIGNKQFEFSWWKFWAYPRVMREIVEYANDIYVDKNTQDMT